jgi:purine-binding chemotaxis protein CheW
MSKQTQVVFEVAGVWCSLAREDVRRILPLPAVNRPPGLPKAMEGLIDLAGTAVPVLRLDRLFELPESPPDIYQHLIQCSEERPPLALMVDRVTDVVTIRSDMIAPLAEGESFNACVLGQFALGDRRIHVLSCSRLLDERERQMLAEFHAVLHRRHERLETQA